MFTRELGVWDHLHLDMVRLLRRDGKLEHETAVIDSTHVRAFDGGEKTGPSPVDRRKPGTKYTLMTDRNGVPLAVQIEGGNRSDQREILPMIEDEFPHVSGRSGRPRIGPKQVVADAGNDSESTREVLRCLGMRPMIRKRGSPHGSHLGRVRWVVERSIAWLKGLRRLRVRYDRSRLVIDAWATLAMSILTFRIWHHDVNLTGQQTRPSGITVPFQNLVFCLVLRKPRGLGQRPSCARIWFTLSLICKK